MTELKAGDVVMLKSGGPIMVISYVDTFNNLAHCEWFCEGQIKQYRFNPKTLKEVE